MVIHNDDLHLLNYLFCCCCCGSSSQNLFTILVNSNSGVTRYILQTHATDQAELCFTLFRSGSTLNIFEQLYGVLIELVTFLSLLSVLSSFDTHNESVYGKFYIRLVLWPRIGDVEKCFFKFDYCLIQCRSLLLWSQLMLVQKRVTIIMHPIVVNRLVELLSVAVVLERPTIIPDQ